MEKDCPRCGLINPPTALQCDCGWDFQARRHGMTNLTEKDRAQEAANARQLYVLPASPFPGCGCLLLAVIQGTNGPGAVLLLITTVGAAFVSSMAGGGPFLFATLLGSGTIAIDLLVRRFVLRCALADTKRGSKFMHLPLWAVGLPPLALGVPLCLARPG